MGKSLEDHAHSVIIQIFFQYFAGISVNNLLLTQIWHFKNEHLPFATMKYHFQGTTKYQKSVANRYVN